MSARTGSVKHVTSTANPLIKAVRALHQRKARAESGLFLAEGHKLVLDALAAGWTPTMIVAMEPATDAVSDLGARVRALGADVVFANAAVMEKVALVESLLDRGVLADGSRVSKQPGRCCVTGCEVPERVTTQEAAE